MTKTNVAVVGVGRMGRFHALNLAKLPDVNLVAVVDARAEQAKAVAAEAGPNVKALASTSDLPKNIDAVSICVPTVHHYRAAESFLKAGVGVLMEKPLAFSPEEAEAMVRLADKHRATLAVGHIERFSPPWQALLADPPCPNYIEAERLSPYPFRSIDVSVVFDVMIHDLDLILSLGLGRVESVQAVGDRVLSPSVDRAHVWLTFSSGTRAHVSASRVNKDTSRRMRLHAAAGTTEVDFLTKSLKQHQLAKSVTVTEALAACNLDQATQASRRSEWFATSEESYPAGAGPLADELADFVAAVREQKSPMVSGEAGAAAVRLAAQIEDMLSVSTTVRRAA